MTRRLCVQCHRWIERSEKWWAEHPGTPLHPGKCQCEHAAYERDAEAQRRRAGLILKGEENVKTETRGSGD